MSNTDCRRENGEALTKALQLAARLARRGFTAGQVLALRAAALPARTPIVARPVRRARVIQTATRAVTTEMPSFDPAPAWSAWIAARQAGG